jgi:hypothetical protein
MELAERMATPWFPTNCGYRRALNAEPKRELQEPEPEATWSKDGHIASRLALTRQVG